MSALYETGVRHLHGDGVSRDMSAAAHMFERAVEQSHPGAQRALGLLLWFGAGVAADRVRARRLLAAASAADATAHLALGEIELLEQGDAGAAVAHFATAAAMGLAEAQCALGTCYDYGTGVAVDRARAAALYAQSAAQGLAQSQFNLGACYLEGVGVGADAARAHQLFVAAAAQGHAEACTVLGDLTGRVGGAPDHGALARGRGSSAQDP